MSFCIGCGSLSAASARGSPPVSSWEALAKSPFPHSLLGLGHGCCSGGWLAGQRAACEKRERERERGGAFFCGWSKKLWANPPTLPLLHKTFSCQPEPRVEAPPPLFPACARAGRITSLPTPLPD